MRLLIQIAAMLSDAMLIGASSYLVYTDGAFLLLVIPAFLVWHKQGGFMAWHPANIRRFLKNEKDSGQ